MQSDNSLTYYNKIMETIPDEIKDFLKIHGYNAAITGGFIRDFICGKKPNDLDIVITYDERKTSFTSLFSSFYDISETSRISNLKEGNYSIKFTDIRLKNGQFVTVNLTLYNGNNELSALDIIQRNFDFNINMLFINSENNCLCSAFLFEPADMIIYEIKNKILKVNNTMSVWNVNRMIERLSRFVTREGYKINKTELIKYKKLINYHLENDLIKKFSTKKGDKNV